MSREPDPPEHTAAGFVGSASRSPRRSPVTAGPRRPDSERTRHRILDAATQEFAARGYSGTRTQAIASRAKVNQQLIPYYFDSKDGLYRAVLTRTRGRLEQLMASTASTGERLQALVLDAVEDATALRLMAWEALENRAPSGPNDTADHPISFLAGRLGERPATPLFTDLDLDGLAIMLLAAAMAPITQATLITHLISVDPRSPEFLRGYANQLTSLARYLGLDD